MVRLIFNSWGRLIPIILAVIFSFTAIFAWAQTEDEQNSQSTGIAKIVNDQEDDDIIQAFKSSGEKRYVLDNADIISPEAEAELTAELLDIYHRTGAISFIVTKKQINKSAQDAADDLFDQLVNYQKGMNIEGTLILIALQDPAGQRKVHISTSGDRTIPRLQNSIDALLDSFVNAFQSNNSYDEGLKAYVKKLDRKISDNSISQEDAAGGGLAGAQAEYEQNPQSTGIAKIVNDQEDDDIIQAFKSSGEKRYVIDNANIISPEAEAELTAALLDIYHRTGAISFIVTKKSISKSAEAAADDLFDQLVNYQKGMNIEGTLILIALQDPTGQRKVHISTSGDRTIPRLQNSIDALLDSFVNAFQSNNSYDEGLKAYVKKLDRKISDNSISEEDAAGGGLAGVLAAIFAFFRKKKSYQLGEKPMPQTWKAQAPQSVFAVSYDNFLGSTVSERVIETSSSSSSGGHSSSSGNYHGGGGRSF